MVPKDSKELGWMAGIALLKHSEKKGEMGGGEAGKDKEEQVIKGVYSQHTLSISH